MTDQPPVQPPHQPDEPSSQPERGNPATQPMPAAGAASAPSGGVSAPPETHTAPTTNLWHQTTSTRGGRWAIGIAAVALAALMVLGVGVAGLLVLRNHDRFGMMGQRGNGFSRDLDGRGNGQGRGPGGNNGYQAPQPGMPGAPDMRGGRLQGLGGLGGLQGGALHGSVTATVGGSVQTLVFQRGAVTAVSGTSITLKSSDGFTGTYGRTTATRSMMAAPVTGGQAFVLARASDKVAISITSTQLDSGVGPSS